MITFYVSTIKFLFFFISRLLRLNYSVDAL